MSFLTEGVEQKILPQKLVLDPPLKRKKKKKNMFASGIIHIYAYIIILFCWEYF